MLITLTLILVILAPRRPAEKSRSRQVPFVGAADRSQRSRLSAGDDHHRRARAGVRVVRDAAQAHVLLQGDEAMRVRPRPDGLACAADTDTRTSHCDVLDSCSLICALPPSSSDLHLLAHFIRPAIAHSMEFASCWVCWELAIHFAFGTVFVYPFLDSSFGVCCVRLCSGAGAYACIRACVDRLHVWWFSLFSRIFFVYSFG